MSSTDNLPRPADSPCLKCASAGCTSITIGKGDNRRKVDCCESCIFNKGNKGPLCPLYGSPMGWDGFGGKENG